MEGERERDTDIGLDIDIDIDVVNAATKIKDIAEAMRQVSKGLVFRVWV